MAPTPISELRSSDALPLFLLPLAVSDSRGGIGFHGGERGFDVRLLHQVLLVGGGVLEHDGHHARPRWGGEILVAFPSVAYLLF